MIGEHDKTQKMFFEADRGVITEKDGQCRCMGCMGIYPSKFDCCPDCGYFRDSKVENALHLYPGTILDDKYVVGKVIGYGGFGVTYLAWDTVLQIKVAIKEYLPSEFSTRSAGQTRITVFSGEKNKQFKDGKEKFIDEAKRLAAFRNEPGIVKIFNCFEENETAYIAMEFLEGETLASRLEKEKTLSADDAVQMLMPVIESLNKVHDKGIIHRDIAPDNIFITKKGDVKLIDFGASRYATVSESRSLTVIIKPGYSAEEQYRSRGDQGSFTDVYSVGAVLYKMVTGQNPPDAMERRSMFEKTGKDMLAPISKFTKRISKNQENAIYNALNIRIDDRTPDMITLAGELMSDEPVKRRKSGIRKLDVLRWPLWAKIGVPSAIAAVVVLAILFMFGIIGPKSGLSTDFVIPEGQTMIPNIVACSYDDAQDMLNKHDLNWRIKDTRLSDKMDSGLVLVQEPDAGNLAPVGTYIDIVISSGLGIEFVEDFTGFDSEEAKKILEDLGFKVETKEKRSQAYGEGIVFDQSVKGESLEKGSVITLFVSKGQKVDPTVEVEIPDVLGKTYDEASELLLGKNLTIVKSTKTAHDASKKVGEIVEQTPAAGTKGHEGDKVTVVINAGAQTVRVPDVVNITQAQAVKDLESAGLKANVEYGQNKNYAAGTVYAQSIDAYKEVAPGTTVTITVSSGEETATVPKETAAASDDVIDKGTCGNNLTWILDTAGKLVISGTGNMYDWEMTMVYAPWHSNRESIKSITIGNGVTSIGDFAFTGCTSLTSVTIGNSVTNIGYCAFYYCYSLKSITIPNGVTSTGPYAFQYCEGLTSIAIPNSVTIIDDGSFQGCENLASVKIPDSVTSIGKVAFEGCNSLTDVHYSGTKEEWNKISIGLDNESLTNATIHYNSAKTTTTAKATTTMSKKAETNGSKINSSDYTIIRTANDLNAIRSNLSGKYVLASNIDLSSWGNWNPIGNYDSPFTGTIDGNGYSIKNLSINLYSDATKENGIVPASFIAVSSGAKIKNLGIENATIKHTHKGLENSGNYSFCIASGIVGEAMNSTEIERCYFTGSISSNATQFAYARSSGIASCYSSSVKDCYVDAEISASAAYANTMVGGIAAWNKDSKIERCHSAGSLYAENTNSLVYLGGIAGSGSGEVSNSVVLLDSIETKGKTTYNGNDLIDVVSSQSKISNNKVINTIQNIPNKSSTTITSTQSVQEETYTNMEWDFNSVWKINNKYPVHK